MTVLHNLPKRQREVLHFVVRNIEDKEESPTIHEIADGTGIAPAQVQGILDALELKGRIKREPHKSRSITVVQ